MRAVDLHTQACGAGVAAACIALGEIYRRGDKPPTDRALAQKSFEKACELGSEQGCTLAGRGPETQDAPSDGVDAEANPAPARKTQHPLDR